ncbi:MULTISPECIES: carbohydrate ABC transporter permease [unclassified Shinella]|uniref:carbohydrate ABC transporter permease n=1 Tax=unclassified Shinella TaxID=2643062 RepID=UPI00225C71D0|nr:MULTISPECIES: sugar ABC transporter permease [unclassified Shinella]MCW5709329.1 sugar ABC transporter permease [Shinella sp.]MDC7258915.1 sugar ABC transporter permease [Shinella sp. YE25]CAI0334307.1 Multiple sugar transport system permease protein [Rhizobiaceae bacterium]CAK7260491.1 multiple sugar transport system permease protein [Shinella sp. WSC3-e]
MAYAVSMTRAPKEATRRSFLHDDRFQMTAFIAPTCIFLALLTIWPFIYSVYLSLHAVKLTAMQRAVFIGLDNYINLLTDPLFLRAMLNTGMLAVTSITCEIVIAFVIAKAFVSLSHLKWVNGLRSLFMIPMMVTPLIVGMIFSYVFNPVLGIANYLLGGVGLGPVPWFGGSTAAMISILLINIWQWTPFMMLLIMAGLLSIRADLYEAARVDGAKWHHVMRFLEIPSIKGIVLLGVILRIIDTLRFFDVVYVTTRGGPGDSTMVLTLYAYQQNFQFFQAGVGSAAAVIILVISIVITTFAVKLLRRIEDE